MFAWWRKWQRQIDLRILWPECKSVADQYANGSLLHAKAAFMYHIVNDSAWTKDYTHTELIKIVDDLQ